jgi:acyl-CoA synthetase (AMP-forming)/AMP-acid ligase II
MVKSTKIIRLLHESLSYTAQNYSEKIAIIAGNEKLTYKQFADKANALASYLHSNELECGDRVGIYMDNTWRCCVAIYAILISGGVFHIINPQTKADKLKYILEDSEAKFLITDEHLSKQFITVINKLAFLSQVICSGDLSEDTKDIEKIIEYDPILENFSSPPLNIKSIPVDLAALIYTSGTTGDPKGVMMTHQAMVFAT